MGGAPADRPRQRVLAGVLESVADRERTTAAFELPVRSVRLTASAAEADRRLRRRYGGERPAALAWHLERHEALAARLGDASLDELAIDTDGVDPRSIAQRVLQHARLLPASSVL